MMEFGMWNEIDAWQYCEVCGNELVSILNDKSIKYNKYNGERSYYTYKKCPKNKNYDDGHTQGGYWIPEQEYLRRK